MTNRGYYLGFLVFLFGSLDARAVYSAAPAGDGGSSTPAAPPPAASAPPVAAPAVGSVAAAPVARAAAPPGITVLATAPAGDPHLGGPTDAAFVFLQGPAGASLFPTTAIRKAARGELQSGSEAQAVQTDLELKANMAAWPAEIRAGATTDRRFATLRSHIIEYVLEVDDTLEMRQPPPEAVYYVYRVYYGWQNEFIVSGDTTTMYAGAEVGLGQLAVSGKQQRDNLKWKVHSLGIKAGVDSAIFMSKPEDLQKFRMTEPVPIYIEYRALPGRDVRASPLLWREPSRATIRPQTFLVRKNGVMFGSKFSARWSGTLSCGPVASPASVDLWPMSRPVRSGQTIETATRPIEITYVNPDEVLCTIAVERSDKPGSLAPEAFKPTLKENADPQYTKDSDQGGVAYTLAYSVEVSRPTVSAPVVGSADPKLGIVISAPTAGDRDRLRATAVVGGVVVRQVEVGSRAAGLLQVDDLMVTIDNVPVRSVKGLLDVLGTAGGRVSTVWVMRNGAWRRVDFPASR